MQALQQSVQSVIDDGRIGSPVFLRLMACLPTEQADVVQSTAALATFANAWMPSSPEQVYVQSSDDSVQSTVMIQYAGGQTAILSMNHISANRDASIELTLIGNKGVIYHETPVGRHRLVTPSIELGTGSNLITLIKSAIETGKPVQVKGA